MVELQKFKRAVLLGCASMLAISADGGFAQATTPPETSTSVQGDIIVTATRQEVQLSKVPASVAAYTQELMDKQGVRSIQDISKLTPGVTFTRSSNFTGSQTNIAIRGVQSTIGAGTTGIYIDDTPIQVRAVGNSSTNPYPLIFDLNRVEVLRGPQGTLFGAGAEGGTVRFVTPGPSMTKLEGYGRSEFSFTRNGDPSYEAGLAVGAPIVTDKLGFRVSAWYRRDGGYIDRVLYPSLQTADKNANWSNSRAFKAELGWKPMESLTITPSVYYQKVYTNDSSAYWENISPSKNQLRNAFVLQQPVRDRFVLPSLKAELELGWASVISNTSYFDRKFVGTYDYTVAEAQQWTGQPFVTIPGQNAPTLMDNRQKNFTQELRIQSPNADSRFNWVVGVFYSKARQRALQVVDDAYLDQLIAAAIPGGSVRSLFGSPLLNGRTTFISNTVTHDKQLAGFGQISYELFTGLKLTAGARIASTKFDFVRNADGPVAGGPSTRTGGQKESPITPKFGVSYQADPATLLYASAAKGFRVGGTQAPPRALCGPDLAVLGFNGVSPTFDSDSVWTYEGGVKTKLAGGAVRAEGSVYHTDWKNIQQSIYLPSCASTFIGNLGSASINGFEAALSVTPAHGLQLAAAVGYTKAKFDETIAVGSTFLTRKGARLPITPWTVTLSGSYDFDLLGRDTYVRADYQYLSRNPDPNPLVFGYDRTLPPQPASNQLSARAGVRFNGFDISVFVDNLLNDLPGLARSHITPTSPLYFNATYRPRTIGATGTVRF